nr:Spy/CpxP family protein refolding chaperone [Allomuricauda sp.]
MKKNLLTTILLLFLIIMNGVLLYLVLNEPQKHRKPPGHFIARELGLTEEQMVKFRQLERSHRKKMRFMDHRLHEMRQFLFSNAQNENFSMDQRDSLTNEMGKLSAEKDLEVFQYFQEIGELCTAEQRQKLEETVARALKRGPGKKGPPPGEPHNGREDLP